LWLGTLRALSTPAAEAPPVVRSDAWGRRVLASQLASWAELRHDNVLYAKQSYTAGIECSYPDVYVDPYPAVWQRPAKYADLGQALMGSLDLRSVSILRARTAGFFTNLGTVARRLGRIAERQRNGERPSKDDIDFMNQALFEKAVDPGCGGPI